jgi:thioredoxin reductase (NADPH)
MKLYDCIVIGGGPAGLSAAIYLARFNRKVLIIDREDGRSTYPQVNHNYLGFPNGISALELREKGRKQAEKYNANFTFDEISEIKGKYKDFTLIGKKTYHAKTIIIASGVIDLFPIYENYKEYIGKSMFWCIACDGYKTIGKKTVIVGNNDEAAITCMQFLNYTKDLIFLTNVEESATNISTKVKNNLARYKISLIEEKIINVEGKEGMMERIDLSNGKSIEVDSLFSQQGSNPNCSLAMQLGVTLTKDGFVEADEHQRTSHAGVYAAGDVTRHYSHQVVSAAHEGAMAAETANYDLYEPHQKQD